MLVNSRVIDVANYAKGRRKKSVTKLSQQVCFQQQVHQAPWSRRFWRRHALIVRGREVSVKQRSKHMQENENTDPEPHTAFKRVEKQNSAPRPSERPRPLRERDGVKQKGRDEVNHALPALGARNAAHRKVAVACGAVAANRARGKMLNQGIEALVLDQGGAFESADVAQAAVVLNGRAGEVSGLGFGVVADRQRRLHEDAAAKGGA